MNRNKGPLAAALGAKMSMEKKSASSDSSSRKSESGNRSPRKYDSSADRDLKGRARETSRRDNRYSEQKDRKDRDAKCRDKDSGRRDRDRDSKSSRYLDLVLNKAYLFWHLVIIVFKYLAISCASLVADFKN